MNADVHDLVGAYSIDALPSDERAFFERHLEACETCQRESEELRAIAATLGAAAAEQPPPSLRDRVLDETARTRQMTPADRAAPTSSSPRRRLLLAGVAGVALLFATGFGLLSAQLAGRLADAERELADVEAALVAVLDQSDVNVAELESPPGTNAHLLSSQVADRALLVTDGLPGVPEDSTYQLWVLRDGVADPEQVFRSDGGRVVIAVQTALREADLVAVTVEPRGGSPRPSGDILIQGPIDA